MSPEPANFSVYLIAWREHKGMSREEAALRLRVPYAVLHDWEEGQIELTDYNLDRLARFYGVPRASLLSLPPGFTPPSKPVQPLPAAAAPISPAMPTEAPPVAPAPPIPALSDHPRLDMTAPIRRPSPTTKLRMPTLAAGRPRPTQAILSLPQAPEPQLPASQPATPKLSLSKGGPLSADVDTPVADVEVAAQPAEPPGSDIAPAMPEREALLPEAEPNDPKAGPLVAEFDTPGAEVDHAVHTAEPSVEPIAVPAGADNHTLTLDEPSADHSPQSATPDTLDDATENETTAAVETTRTTTEASDDGATAPKRQPSRNRPRKVQADNPLFEGLHPDDAATRQARLSEYGRRLTTAAQAAGLDTKAIVEVTLLPKDLVQKALSGEEAPLSFGQMALAEPLGMDFRQLLAEISATVPAPSPAARSRKRRS